MPIQSRQDLIDYCLRKLGAPVIDINVSIEQLSDRIDEAIQYYQEYHSDSVIPLYMKYTVTSTDISNKYITLPENIVTVKRVLPANLGGTDGLFDYEYQLHLNDEYLLRGGVSGSSISYYYQTQQFLSLINNQFGVKNNIEFNRHMNRLFMHVDWSDIKENNDIIIQCDSIVDADVYTDVFNDHYLKMYLTQLIKLQWAQNMSKFQNMQLPGGVQIDAQRMMDEANEEITKLKEEMRLTWELPVNFYVG